MNKFAVVVVLFVTLSACQSGIQGRQLDLPMQHSQAEKKAISALKVVKDAAFSLPATKQPLPHLLYNQQLVIPKDLREKH